MANTQTTENVSLKGPEDWETWNTQFESKAISTDIWRLISPDEDGGHRTLCGEAKSTKDQGL